MNAPEPQTVTAITAAPESYDGFGTETAEWLPWSDLGHQLRRVQMSADFLDWQDGRYASGGYRLLTDADVETLRSAGILRAVQT